MVAKVVLDVCFYYNTVHFHLNFSFSLLCGLWVGIPSITIKKMFLFWMECQHMLTNLLGSIWMERFGFQILSTNPFKLFG